MGRISVWRSHIKTLLRFAAKLPVKPTDRASKSAAGKFNPAISRSLEDVARLLAAADAKRICVNGPAAFLESVTAALTGIELTWVSTDFRDIEHGALFLEQIDLSSIDAVLCGGARISECWRLSLQQALVLQEAGTVIPLHWVASNWEFCAGTLPVPVGADDAEALLFNHFEHFFGVRDPLQFKVTIYHGPEEKHFYRVLEPNQSITIKLSDFFPVRKYTAAFSATVEHPMLTRGRHYRMRLCGDVFWRNSLTTLHSAHEFNRKPDRTEEFRLSDRLVRSGEIALTIPNFDRNQTAGSIVETYYHGQEQRQPRSLTAYVGEVRLDRAASAAGLMNCRYQGYGGSFWFAFDRDAAGDDKSARIGASFSGNHHISVPWRDRVDMPQSAEEAARLKQLAKAGFMADPHPVPIMGADQRLHFGFDCDASNPPCRIFLLHLFDADGQFIATTPYEKTHDGPSFPRHFLGGIDDALTRQVRLALVAPDWLKHGQARAGYKLLLDMVVEDRRSGDRDVTEFQSCWRNLGVVIEGFPHWLSPANGIIGRSNLTARVRHGDGYTSGLMIVNGSGSRHYKRSAKVKVVVYDQAGAQKEAVLEIRAFTQRLVWLHELMSDLEDFLGGKLGAILVRSADADLNCQLITTNQHGAVSLQHLWGY